MHRSRIGFCPVVTIPLSYETAAIPHGHALLGKRFGPERLTPLPCPHQVRSRVSTALRFVSPARGPPAIPNAPGARLPPGPWDRCPFHYHESATGRIGGHTRFRLRYGWRARDKRRFAGFRRLS